MISFGICMITFGIYIIAFGIYIIAFGIYIIAFGKYRIGFGIFRIGFGKSWLIFGLVLNYIRNLNKPPRPTDTLNKLPRSATTPSKLKGNGWGATCLGVFSESRILKMTRMTLIYNLIFEDVTSEKSEQEQV